MAPRWDVVGTDSWGAATRAGWRSQSFRPAIDVRLDLGALAADIAEVQGRIKEAFYANLFLMLAESDRREITARDRRAARGEDADARADATNDDARLSTAISFGIDHRPSLAVESQGRAGRGLSNPSCPPIQAGRCIRVHVVRACPPVLRRPLFRRVPGLQTVSGHRERTSPRLPDCR
jgi:hypothetical protein